MSDDQRDPIEKLESPEAVTVDNAVASQIAGNHREVMTLLEKRGALRQLRLLARFRGDKAETDRLTEEMRQNWAEVVELHALNAKLARIGRDG